MIGSGFQINVISPETAARNFEGRKNLINLNLKEAKSQNVVKYQSY